MNFIQTVLLMSLFSFIQQNGNVSKTEMCPQIFASLPSEIKPFSDSLLARYELRRCPDEEIQVVGWMHGALKPEIVVNTGDFGYSVLFHKFNVLALQTSGGASDHVYVFAFKSGVPKLVLKTATKDEITVRSERSGKEEMIIVEVPPTTYPNELGEFSPTPKPKAYRFAVEF
jgi:hypothetical protein